MKKFDTEKARLKDEFNHLEDLEGHLQQELLVLPYMLNLPKILQDSSLAQQHTIINDVFKRGFTFKNGPFGTPWINPELALKKSNPFSLDFPSGRDSGAH